jgi:hypothetical protein
MQAQECAAKGQGERRCSIKFPLRLLIISPSCSTSSMLGPSSGLLRVLSDILHYRPIINATYSDDGSVQDICRALSMRLREPNAVVGVQRFKVLMRYVDNNLSVQVVFKALLVLHSMIRLGQQDLLRLRNVVGQTWDGKQPLSLARALR